MPDPILDLAAEWRANNPGRARTHRPVFKGNPFFGWYIDGDTPITRGPANLAGGYTIPGPTAAQLAHGAPLATGGIIPPAMCRAWHYVNRVGPNDTRYAAPARCVRRGSHPFHVDHTGRVDGRWFTGPAGHLTGIDETDVDERTQADVAALLEETRDYAWPRVPIHVTRRSEPPAPTPVDEPVIPAAHAQSLTARAAAFLRSLLDDIAADLGGHR